MKRRSFFAAMVGGSAVATAAIPLANKPDVFTASAADIQKFREAWERAELDPRAYRGIVPAIVPIWTGDTEESIKATPLIHCFTPHTGPSDAECLRFYRGDQWDKNIMQQRRSQARPCLVINKLPHLVAVSIRKSSGNVDSETLIAITCAITRRNMDAQRLYNFTASAAAEQASLLVKMAGKKVA